MKKLLLKMCFLHLVCSKPDGHKKGGDYGIAFSLLKDWNTSLAAPGWGSPVNFL